MIDEVYKNRMVYYNAMKDLLSGEISPLKFREKYWGQRFKDLNENDNKGYTNEIYEKKLNNLMSNEKRFKNEYFDVLFEEGSLKLEDYEKGANELDMRGELFFIGIWNFIDCYVKDYYPSDDEGFDPIWNVDEQTLTERIQKAFDVLERNKERWEYNEDESIKI